MKKSIAFVLALLLPSAPVSAQVAGSRPDPSDPAFRVPQVPYVSPFGKYRRLTDERVARWKDTNDTVEKIGGWQVYLKEGRQPEPAAVPEPAASGPSGPQGK